MEFGKVSGSKNNWGISSVGRASRMEFGKVSGSKNNWGISSVGERPEWNSGRSAVQKIIGELAQW